VTKIRVAAKRLQKNGRSKLGRPKAGKGKLATLMTLLSGGDRRSIGGADEAANLAANDPRLFRQLIRGLWDANAVVRMRAADAAEKASREAPAMLNPFKSELLGLLAETTQQELRWHLAQMVPRLPLTPAERDAAAATFRGYLSDKSSIVRTFAMQAFAGLAEKDEKVRAEVVDLLRELSRSGTSAMRARGRKLLARVGTFVAMK
jgi:hypothetical protein